MSQYGRGLCQLILAAAALKLLVELAIFNHLRSKRLTPLRRTAMLLAGPLAVATMKRFFLGVIGGVVLPWMLLSGVGSNNGDFNPPFVGLAVVLMLVANVLGELAERYLFFRAVVAPKMPGAPAAG